jgi:hypothetical protein
MSWNVFENECCFIDKLLQTGQNLGRVINFRSGPMQAVHLLCYEVKLTILILKTRPKQLLGYLPLDTNLHSYFH